MMAMAMGISLALVLLRLLELQKKVYLQVSLQAYLVVHLVGYQMRLARHP
jgi:hypothetical protein